MTERSEYTTSESEYAQTLETEEKAVPGSPEFEEKMAGFRARMAKYRLYAAKLTRWERPGKVRKKTSFERWF
jgi:hypothetical protein